MTTAEKLRAAEKLLSRLAERKRLIIEHVKQRTELYSQHLASKLLIEGIDPPSWLGDPSTSGLKELIEEDLIPKLLRQFPQPSAPWSAAGYPGNNNLVISGDHEKFSNGIAENSASNKDLHCSKDPEAPGFSGQDHGEHAFKIAAELDASAASPEYQKDEMILSMYTVSDQSLAGIQRSKSRQKALELRSSAKTQANSGLRPQSINDAASSHIRFSPGQYDELSQLGEPCIIDSQSCESRNVVDAYCSSKEMGEDINSERIIRSEAYAEVPISFPLGFSSEDYKENASNQVARVRRKESMPIFDTENAENHVNKSPKSTGPSPVCCESLEGYIPDQQLRTDLRDRGEESANLLRKDDEKNVFTGEIIRSEISSRKRSSGLDLNKADTSKDNYEGINITMMDSGNDLPSYCVDRAPMKISISNICIEGCDDQESVLEDFGRYKDTNSIPSLSSIQCNACIDEAFDLEVHSATKIYGDILTPSSSGSARQLNDSQELSGLDKPSEVLSRRMTTSQTCSYGKETYQPKDYGECAFKMVPELNARAASPTNERILSIYSVSDQSLAGIQMSKPSQKALELRISAKAQAKNVLKHQSINDAASSQIRFSFSTNDQPGQNDELSQLGEPCTIDNQCCENRDAVEADCLRREMGVDVRSDRITRSENYAKVQVPVVRSFSLNFLSGDYKENASNQVDRVRRKESMPIFDSENAENNVHESPKSTGPSPVFCQNLEGNSLVQQLIPGLRDRLEDGANLLGNDDEKNVNNGEITRSEISIRRPSCSRGLTNGDSYFDDYQGINSTMMDSGDDLPPDFVDGSLMKINLSNICNEGYDARESVLGDFGRYKERNAIPSLSSIQCNACTDETSDLEVPSASATVYGDVLAPLSAGSGRHDNDSQERSGLVKPSDGSSRTVTRSQTYSYDKETYRPAIYNENPPFKGRLSISDSKEKLAEELQNTSGQSAPPCFGISEMLHEDKTGKFVMASEFCLLDHYDKSSPPNSNYFKQSRELESEVVLSPPHSSVCEEPKQLEFNETEEHNLKALTFGSGKKLSCFLHDLGASLDQEGICGGNDQPSSSKQSPVMSGISSEGERAHRDSCEPDVQESPSTDIGLHLQHSVFSSSNEDLQVSDVYQSMPVFEGFTVNAQTETDELDIVAEGFDLGKLELPETTLERASILAEICRSASLDRALSHFSSTFKFRETENLCKSLSDDSHLDHLEFENDSSSADYTDALDGMPYSVSLAYSGERYGWDSRNQPPSPVGKLWNQLSTHTGSSGKSSSSNPELTCFPIEEDPISSEESMIMEENAGDTLDETDSSLGNYCDKRQPLTDLTNRRTNPPMLVSAEEETMRADSVDFLRQKVSVTGTQGEALFVPKYQYRKMSESIGKQTSCTRASDSSRCQLSSIGQNAIKKAKDSVSNSISKPIVSNKTSLKGQKQKLSLRESKRNNIVSNVSSFIPLIQQKQAAATSKGKRDVKVKALEAAEALKRLQEKTDIERKRKKEELKCEREQKKLKHMELEKKKKEDERKKKDVAIIAKKRLREAEERKEKEKKKMRLECGQRQWELDGKKRVDRPEKEIQRSKDNQMNSKTEFNNESKRQQKREITRGEGVALQKADTDLSINEVLVTCEEPVTSGISCDGEPMHAVDKSPRNENLIVQKNKEKSYDISPYQSSDDEGEEDIELPRKKYIPSWTSRSSIAQLLSLKLKLEDADVIFPPDSSCSVDEVLQPRKLRQKQVAA